MIKVIYNQKLFPSFSKFKLNIPMGNDRFIKIAEFINDENIKQKKFEIIDPCPSEGDFPKKNDLLLVHNADYVEQLYSADLPKVMNRCFEYTDSNGAPKYAAELPSLEVAQSFRDHIFRKVNQVKKSIEVALDDGFAFCLGGGMHHARQDYGHGFCLVHDFLISAKSLMAKREIKKVLIVDVDAHLGDGTLSCVANDERFFIIDFHMKEGWPYKEESIDIKHQADIHVGIDAKTESQYNSLLQSSLREVSNHDFDLAICLLGADPYEKDVLDSTRHLNLSLQELLLRDQSILKFLKSKQVPTCVLLAGGYGEESWKVSTQLLSWLSSHEAGFFEEV